MRKRLEKVAFQGEKGAFSQVAVHQLLGERVEVVPCQRFDEVFRHLAEGRVNAAVLPIENTLHGSVHENYDHLLEFELPIVGETSVRIVHNLIALPGISFKKIRRVFSHPVALNQCLKFFAANPQIEKVPFYDTAGSVKMLVEEKLTDAAAIASSVAAGIYAARILKRSIEDDRENYTRFFLLHRPGARQSSLPGSKSGYKTSLVFTTRNVPGALFRALSAFALRDLNLTKIESRPLRGKPWEYLFYLDFLGRTDDPTVQNALRHLGELADFLRVLGCYPRGD
jgi:prephenate dehydratase